MLMLARTTPAGSGKRKTEGLTLFYTALDRKHVEVREIPKMGRSAVDSNELFIDKLPVPAADRIGEEGKGFEYILHGMNAERVLIAAEAVGLGRAALRKAAAYAKERVVFGRPIGQNQAIAHPLAKCWAELEAANLMIFKAASFVRRRPALRRGSQCREISRRPRRRSTRARAAMLTHGGMGYAKEFHVERYLREVMIVRLAPVSQQMILNFIAEKVLGPAENRIKALRSARGRIFHCARRR